MTYVGLDANAGYIQTARERHGDRGTFRCFELGRQPPPALGRFDRVLADGVLHHLAPQTAAALLALAAEVLRPDGHLGTVEPYFVEHQRWIARRLIAADRGRHVRTVSAYEELAKRSFHDVDATLHGDLLKLPYDLVLMKCRNPISPTG